MDDLTLMSDEQKAERVVANIEHMRANSQEMRQWRNIPLVKECLELLQSIHDDEAATGMAMACGAIIEQLPEYDVPRLVLDILHYELELLERGGEQDGNRYPTVEDVKSSILRLEDYIDIEHLSSEAFREKYKRHLKADPVERTPEWEVMYYDVEMECDRRLGDTPRGMGFCFAYWSTLRQVLSERGIEWHSPSELNPRVLFD